MPTIAKPHPLRAWLDCRGMSIPGFANLIGVGAPAVWRYLDGKRIPRAAIMQRILTATDNRVKIADFYNWKD